MQGQTKEFELEPQTIPDNNEIEEADAATPVSVREEHLVSPPVE